MKRLSILLAVFMVAAPALAYVLPSDALLQLFAERRQRLHASTLEVDGSLTLIDVNGGRRIVPASHKVEFDDRCRLEIEASDDEQLSGVFTAYDQGHLTPPTDPTLADLGILEALACPLVASRKHAATEVGALLTKLGVDQSYTGLSRLEGRPATIIGARPWETDKPQLWLDQQTRLPVRVVGKVQGVLADVHLVGYSDPATGEWHPREMQLYEGGQLRLELTAEHLEQNVKLTADLFR